MSTVEFPYYIDSPKGWDELLDRYRGKEEMVCFIDGTPLFYINVYELDKGWGGPEEGGWWYDIGNAVDSVPVRGYEEARRVYAIKREAYPATSNPPLSSVVYRGGTFNVCIQNHPAKDYPEVQPRYE